MFALDYELQAHPVNPDPRFATTRQIVENLAGWGLPYDYSQYDCHAEIHENGWILVRAYRIMAQQMGVPTVGKLLQRVPAMLPPERTFASVRQAFVNVALAKYGPETREVPRIYHAFEDVGMQAVYDDREHACPNGPF